MLRAIGIMRFFRQPAGNLLRLLKGDDARLSNVNIVLGGATRSDCADTAAVHHDRKTARNGHESTWARRQSDGDRVMVIAFVSARTLFSRRKTCERSAAGFSLRNRNRIQFRLFRPPESEQVPPIIHHGNACWKTQAVRLLEGSAENRHR